MKIFLDRGHGFDYLKRFDPGAGSADGLLYEAAVVHTIGYQAAQMAEMFDIEVVVLPPVLSLWERDDWVNQRSSDGDILVSLHMNSHTEEGPSGVEVLTFSESTAEAARAMSSAAARDLSIRDRGWKMRPRLNMLRNTDIPAFLVELGFINNPINVQRVLNHGASAMCRVFMVLRDYYNKENEL